MKIELNIYNQTDLSNQIADVDYEAYLYLDGDNLIDLRFMRSQIEREENKDDGFDFPERMFYYDEYELTFIINTDTAEFLGGLKEFDTLKIKDTNDTIISPDEWDIEIEALEENDVYNLVKIIYRTNKIVKNQAKTNYTKTVVVTNAPPEALYVVASGQRYVGGFHTIEVGELTVCAYTYYDAEGNPEGVTTFQWYRTDVNGNIIALISGATSSSYTGVAADYGYYLKCKVTPVASAGTLVGTPVYSNMVKVTQNYPPTAENPNLTADGDIEIGTTLTAPYTYNDVDGDLEGTTLFQWYRADNNVGLNETAINGATSQTHTIIAADRYKCLRCRIIPVALTGSTTGSAVYTGYSTEVPL